MPRRQPKEVKPQTVKLSICLTPEIKKKLIDDSHAKFGNRKGAISTNLEHILRIHFGMAIEGVTET